MMKIIPAGKKTKTRGSGMKDKKQFIAHLNDEAEKAETIANDFNSDSYQCGFWEGYAKALQKVSDSIFDETGNIDIEA